MGGKVGGGGAELGTSEVHGCVMLTRVLGCRGDGLLKPMAALDVGRGACTVTSLLGRRVVPTQQQ